MRSLQPESRDIRFWIDKKTLNEKGGIHMDAPFRLVNALSLLYLGISP